MDGVIIAGNDHERSFNNYHGYGDNVNNASDPNTESFDSNASVPSTQQLPESFGAGLTVLEPMCSASFSSQTGSQEATPHSLSRIVISGKDSMPEININDSPVLPGMELGSACSSTIGGSRTPSPPSSSYTLETRMLSQSQSFTSSPSFITRAGHVTLSAHERGSPAPHHHNMAPLSIITSPVGGGAAGAAGAAGADPNHFITSPLAMLSLPSQMFYNDYLANSNSPQQSWASEQQRSSSSRVPNKSIIANRPHVIDRLCSAPHRSSHRAFTPHVISHNRSTYPSNYSSSASSSSFKIKTAGVLPEAVDPQDTRQLKRYSTISLPPVSVKHL